MLYVKKMAIFLKNSSHSVLVRIQRNRQSRRKQWKQQCDRHVSEAIWLLENWSTALCREKLSDRKPVFRDQGLRAPLACPAATGQRVSNLLFSGETCDFDCPRTSLQVEPLPAQTPQLSSRALLPRRRSQPTACGQKRASAAAEGPGLQDPPAAPQPVSLLPVTTRLSFMSFHNRNDRKPWGALTGISPRSGLTEREELKLSPSLYIFSYIFICGRIFLRI